MKILREISPRQIEEKSKANQNIADEGPSSWSVRLITKIILIIFTTANDSSNLAHCLLIAFSDLAKRKHKNFSGKHYAGARAIE